MTISPAERTDVVTITPVTRAPMDAQSILASAVLWLDASLSEVS